MIKGLGTDIIEIDRVRKAYAHFKERFTSRLFDSREWAYCEKYKDPAPHLAARFAGKEAIVKALGGPTIPLKEIVILNAPTGKPHVFLSEKMKKLLNGGNLLISLSHSRTHATATALYTKE